MKYMQVSVKTMLLYPPPYYKSLQLHREQDEQYWKEIAVEFLKKKHNVNTIRKGFPIEIYSGGLFHELYFITLILQGQIIVRPTKKIIISYVVGDLALMD